MRWILALAFALPATALADQTHYVGGHPLVDDGFCHIEAPHVHAIAPVKAHRPLYRVHAKRLHFVGDPSAHGYDGPTVQYVGHHPIAAASYHVDADRQFMCFIDGPHVHAYAPAPSLRFEVKGGAHWYVGPVPPRYKQLRTRYRPMTAYYAEVDYPRPVVTVRPPAAYAFGAVGIGVGVGVSGGVAVPAPAAGVAVEGPSLRATVMAPSVELVVPSVRVEGGVSIGAGVGIGAEPVIVHDHRPPGHYKRRGPKYKRHKRYRKRSKRYRKRNKRYRKRRRGSSPAFRNRHRRDFRR